MENKLNNSWLDELINGVDKDETVISKNTKRGIVRFIKTTTVQDDKARIYLNTLDWLSGYYGLSNVDTAGLFELSNEGNVFTYLFDDLKSDITNLSDAFKTLVKEAGENICITYVEDIKGGIRMTYKDNK